ncbi:MAG: tryptophan synthase subunit alpha [bacterium]
MSRLEARFTKLRKDNRRAFIPFITAGDPNLDLTLSLVLELEKRGADAVELGVPFSDPIADGPVIQRSSERALKKGFSLLKILELVRELRQRSEIPLILMGYYNPIFKFGEAKFVKRSSQAGLDGLIVADLPPEEANDLKKEADKNSLDAIFLLTPVSSEKRIKLVSASSTGFIYCVSYTGITGDERKEEENLKELIGKIRRLTSKPIGIGFGISSPEEAKKAASLADAVIVGSAIVKRIEKYAGNKNLLHEVGSFAERLARAINVS